MGKDQAFETKKEIDLLGGRKMWVITYKNGDVGIEFDRDYMLREHRVIGSAGSSTVARFSPGGQGSAVDQNWLDR